MPTSNKPALTQERLKEILHYDPETGHFTRRVSRSGGGMPGSLAGTVGKDGYRRIQHADRQYLAHRLAFLYMTGALPPDKVDHINRDRSDNRWSNLRMATDAENVRNKSVYSNNTSGCRGVSWMPRLRKWSAYGSSGGRPVYLGVFSELEAADAAAQKWREENYGEFSPT